MGAWMGEGRNTDIRDVLHCVSSDGNPIRVEDVGHAPTD